MASDKKSNAFVSHSADARSSSVDGMYVVPGKTTVHSGVDLEKILRVPKPIQSKWQGDMASASSASL
jgi:hypothetical protein